VTPDPTPKTTAPASRTPRPTTRPRDTTAPETSQPGSTPAGSEGPETPGGPSPSSDPTAPAEVPEPTERPVTAALLPTPGGPRPPSGAGLPPATFLPGPPSGVDLALIAIAWLACGLGGSLLFAFVLGRRTGQDHETPAFAFAMAVASRPVSDVAPPAEPDVLPEPPVVEDAPDPEALIPRWRRPSLQAARKSHFAADVQRVPLRFPAGVAVRDLRLVAYRLVLVADRPDDVDATELGRLDRGDEVEVLREVDGYAQVRAPDGLEGWVIAATLMASPELDDPTGSTTWA
jgi:hypothetical protein